MDDFKKYLDKAYFFLKFRPRSEKELQDYLVKKKAPKEIIEKIITSLKEQKFLDDKEFAKWFMEQRLRFKPKAMRLIKYELKQKGINKEIVDELGIMNNELGQVSDFESAEKLVERKIDKYKNLDKKEIYQKLGGYLARRGFNWDIIKKSIDSILAKRV